VWSNIAAASKLTSVSLVLVWTTSQQSDVVSALTALPDLEQLTWISVTCGQQRELTDSMLLQKLTKLTALELTFDTAAAALEHLGLLTRLQDLSLCVTADWEAAGCPGLQELKALTRLELSRKFTNIPPSVSQLTALQQLDVIRATLAALNKLSVLSGLTRLRVAYLQARLPNSPLVLQRPGLQHLEVTHGLFGTVPMSFLGRCTQLRVLQLCSMKLSGPGSLVASSMLQHLLAWSLASAGSVLLMGLQILSHGSRCSQDQGSCHTSHHCRWKTWTQLYSMVTWSVWCAVAAASRCCSLTSYQAACPLQ